MKSEIEKLIRQKWYLKSSSEKTMKARLACKCDGKEYVANLKFNEMFDEFEPGSNTDPVVIEMLDQEEWWSKVRPILDGDTEEVGEGLTRKWFVPITFQFTSCVDVVAESKEEAEDIVNGMDVSDMLDPDHKRDDDNVEVYVHSIQIAGYGDAEEDE